MIAPDLAATLVRRLGSPLYVYDVRALEARLGELRAALPARAHVYYSLKANPLPAVVGYLHEKGCGAEISSVGELSAAVQARIDPAQIVYTGPAKTVDEMRAAIDARVRRFSCESWSDLERLARAASGRRVEALLRIEPVHPPRGRLSMAGGSGRFGFDEVALLTEPRRASPPEIDIVGVHVYQGTQIDRPETLLELFDAAVACARRVSTGLGIDLRVLHLGGGFPWPWASDEAGQDISPLRGPLSGLCREVGAEIWFESGRYLVGSAGTLLTRVMEVRRGRGGERHVIVDAGINVLGGMSGLRRILQPKVEATPVERRQDAGTPDADLVGPLCTPLDVVGRKAVTHRVAPGEILAIPNVGAYGLTSSLISFLSRPPPIEIVCDGPEILASYRVRAGHERLS